MASLDIFRNDAFSLQSLTKAINEQPYIPGRIGALGSLVFEVPVSVRAHVDVADDPGRGFVAVVVEDLDLVAATRFADAARMGQPVVAADDQFHRSLA